MLIDIALMIIASSLVILAASFIYAIVKVDKILEVLQSDVHRISSELSDLLPKVNQLTTDLQAKSDALNCIFTPLASSHKAEGDGNSRTMPQLMEWVISSAFLIKKTKEFVKKYAKSP